MDHTRVISAVLESYSVVLSLVVILLYMLTSKYKVRSYYRMKYCMVFNTLNVLSDLLALIFRFGTGNIAWILVRVFNYMSFACAFLMMPMLYDYFTEYLSEKIPIIRKTNYVLYGVESVMFLLLFVNLFHPVYFFFAPQYTRAGLYGLSMIHIFLGIGFIAYYLVKYRKYLGKSEKIVMWICILLPLTAMVSQWMFYGIALIGTADTFICVIICLFLQTEREKDLQERQVRLSLSQLQPHFLGNALNTIQFLCDTDQKLAAAATRKFSKYLRMNIDAVFMKGLVDFPMDLYHLDNYLSIEKMRFPNMKFVYDIRDEDFRIPPMTLQPLVEIAIEHRRGEEDTLIKISTREDEKKGEHVICIQDNGENYDPLEDRAYDNLWTVKNKIQMMCRGTLKILSEEQGTTVTIRIPENRKEKQGRTTEAGNTNNNDA
ncbi:MAG: histidine kinase [Eubacteriales bacterium]|nr:histidine kinase [Eubacteriales bacterium]